MKTREGTFVYQALAGVAVRSNSTTDNAYRTSLSVSDGNLVSINFVRELPNGQEFLRLSDGSGWLFTKNESNNEVLMKEIPVESGFWIFYVDNVPVGIHLRNHPMDDTSTTNLQLINGGKMTFKPMQKVYCDKRVVNGQITFYRLQASSCWIFDKRIEATSQEVIYMLIPQHKLKSGLFAYEAITSENEGISVRDSPYTDDYSKISNSSVKIKSGDLICCDIVRQTPHQNSTNGPFLRLTNGMGWLFERKFGNQMMKEVHIDSGLWYFRVIDSIGVRLRKQPSDDWAYHFDKTYKYGEVVTCDRRIEHRSGIFFYRVKGTDGWVSDTQNDSQIMMPCDGSNLEETENSQTNRWTPDFVRGIACATGNLTEVHFNEKSRLITFRKGDDFSLRVTVYYTTRTVGTSLYPPRRGINQLFHRNCKDRELFEIMKNPRIHTNKGYQHKDKKRKTKSMSEEIDTEEDLRLSLLEMDSSLAELQTKRHQLMDSLVERDIERYTEAMQSSNSMQQFISSVRNLDTMKARTCPICNKVFANASVVRNHKDAAHRYYDCQICHEVFTNRNSLNQHISATGHW